MAIFEPIGVCIDSKIQMLVRTTSISIKSMVLAVETSVHLDRKKRTGLLHAPVFCADLIGTLVCAFGLAQRYVGQSSIPVTIRKEENASVR